MSRLQYNLLFTFVLLGGVFVLVAPSFGLKIDPAALTSFGVITTFVLTARSTLLKDKDKEEAP